MQPLCQISKKLYRKSTPCNYLSTALRQQNKPYRYPPCCGVNKVRNSIINIHLPLIFIRLHSQESQFHIKCLICSIKSIYVQIPCFCFSFSSHSPLLHSRSIKQGSKDCWHLVEVLGSAIWPHRHCIFDRQWVEKLQISDFPLPGWIFSQILACHMSSVILTDIIQTECFLSKYTDNMHILASGTE